MKIGGNRGVVKKCWIGVCMFIALGLMFPLSPVQAWNAKGHRLVAGIAESLLKSEARREIETILASETMMGVSKWADDIRSGRPFTAPFHYADFPDDSFKSPLFTKAVNSKTGKRKRHEQSGVLPGALDRFGKALSDPTKSLDERREALKFFIHLMGDLHQPMHCSPPGDSGGNDVKVIFRGQTKNLHKFWDSDVVSGLGGREQPLLKVMTAEAAAMNPSHFSSGNFMDWARESEELAVRNAYSFPPNGFLDDDYFQTGIAIARSQIEKAGVRLAAYLNQVLCKPPIPSSDRKQ
ncbi:MAG: S1/P1 nuclease [Candidatus Ozemobacteraceae bacterium]